MIFSRVCRACGRELVKGENTLCLHCVADIPLWSGSEADLRAARLPRNAPVARVIPWLAYSNSDPVCALIREGKFNDRPELIEDLAKRFAKSLAGSDSLCGVDAIVPVPMHWWKRMLRGYNQAEIIADIIARESGIPMIKAIRAVRSHSVQSRKSGQERAANVSGIFALRKNSKIAPGSHIAVVDDILTTGATLSEAIKTLNSLNPAAVTILTLAATRLN